MSFIRCVQVLVQLVLGGVLPIQGSKRPGIMACRSGPACMQGGGSGRGLNGA